MLKKAPGVDLLQKNINEVFRLQIAADRKETTGKLKGKEIRKGEKKTGH